MRMLETALLEMDPSKTTVMAWSTLMYPARRR
jgi:hypothetical protein